MNFLKNYFSGGLSLSTTFFLFLFGLLLVIIIPNYSNIQEKLGFETKTTLQKQVVQDQNTIQDLQHSNDVNVSNLKKGEESHQASLDAITDHQKTVKDNQTFVDNVKKKINNKPTISETDNSKDQIEAVWEVYCKFNKDNSCTESISST